MFPKLVWTVVEGVVVYVNTKKNCFKLAFPAMLKTLTNLPFSYFRRSHIFLTKPANYDVLTLKQYCKATGRKIVS